MFRLKREHCTRLMLSAKTRDDIILRCAVFRDVRQTSWIARSWTVLNASCMAGWKGCAPFSPTKQQTLKSSNDLSIGAWWRMPGQELMSTEPGTRSVNLPCNLTPICWIRPCGLTTLGMTKVQLLLFLLPKSSSMLKFLSTFNYYVFLYQRHT